MTTTLEWRRNEDGMWAWFDGSRQVTGARGEIGSDHPFAVLDAQGYGLETAYGAEPGETVSSYVLRVHGLAPRGTTPPTEVTIADHPEYQRLVHVYGHLTISQMDERIEAMGAQAHAFLLQYTREFDGRGGRRYSAAMATQAGREIGEERLLLSALRNYRARQAGDGRGSCSTVRAIFLILFVLLALPAAAQRFERPFWADSDHDCRDTRAEVLSEKCSSVTWNQSGCRVVRAVCTDAYSGAEVATDSPSQALQVDHLLPASVAWKRGTWLLKNGARCTEPAHCPTYLTFFNDVQNLNVTRARTNRQKSDLMPGVAGKSKDKDGKGWCPESPAVRPAVAHQFRAVAATYHIPLTASEFAGLRAWDRGVCQ